MTLDLTGIRNQNEYYTNHYFLSIFQENAKEAISAWRKEAKEEEGKTPWARLREVGLQYYFFLDRYRKERSRDAQAVLVLEWVNLFISALGYEDCKQDRSMYPVGEARLPLLLVVRKPSGAPFLFVVPSMAEEEGEDLFSHMPFPFFEEEEKKRCYPLKESMPNLEALLSACFFNIEEPPRFVLLVSIDQVALVDRNKWNEKRCLVFELDDIFGRREETTLQAMVVLLHLQSLRPNQGLSILDQLEENSHRHALSVSQDLKYALREAIELLGNEVLHYNKVARKEKALDTEFASKLTMECLRFMYRILFLLFIEARPELGYAPMKSQVYVEGYSMESLRDIVDGLQEDSEEVAQGFFLHETLKKLFLTVYQGYPVTGNLERVLVQVDVRESLYHIFTMDALKCHLFDPKETPHIRDARLRNRVLLQVIERMSLSRKGSSKKRGRISYAALGINQLGAVYESLLSYRGFFAAEDLYEVKRADEETDELHVGYFVPERDLVNYTEEERVRYAEGENKGKPKVYPKGTFIYRLAGREREKSASYYTPEVLTGCLVKYALKELLRDKTAEEILSLTICEPAMGSAAFLNEAVNQLAESYLDKMQKEKGELVSYEDRLLELQKVKMFIADRNVYGIDLNPVAVELAEISLWLNTIHKGAYVPWFGSQLVCGNSLIGARRQVYDRLQVKKRWYESAPLRILPQEAREDETQIYHFLLGDPGMCEYKDKVIASLAPDALKAMKAWNKEFLKPLTEEEVQTTLNLSQVIDELWELQRSVRREVRKSTTDPLSIFGRDDASNRRLTTIQEKDQVFERAYKSANQENAGAYARLKLAMDYWCALWFWPIDQAEELPTRDEFLFEMSLILEGGIVSVQAREQVSLFEDELLSEIAGRYGHLASVNLDVLKKRLPRLKLVEEIAGRYRFLHWELEFADVFADRGGFDLILGNPPWIKMQWKEQGVLSDKNPVFAIKSYSATRTAKERAKALEDRAMRELYFLEYEESEGMRNFLNALANYPDLKGVQTNLYKCFLPQAWAFGNARGVSAFVHPDGVYDDGKGVVLRRALYPRLRYHFQFNNERKLFPEVDHHVSFSLNVFANEPSDSFENMANLFDPRTIDDSYGADADNAKALPGIKDEENRWSTEGHPQRIVPVSLAELGMYARFFDGTDIAAEARLPAIHAQPLNQVLRLFAGSRAKVADLAGRVFSTEMLHETTAQKSGLIERTTQPSKDPGSLILSGPHIGVANPLFKTPRAQCTKNSDYDSIDLQSISDTYLPRTNYVPTQDQAEYAKAITVTPWGTRYTEQYRLLSRKMLSISGERSLIGAIVPPGVAHIHGIFGVAFRSTSTLMVLAGACASLPFDFLIKTMGKANLQLDNYGKLPLLEGTPQQDAITIRALLLNCLTTHYATLWQEVYHPEMAKDNWAKEDSRLSSSKFKDLSARWNWETPLRWDYERRQALIELDVLVAMALGMNLEQLQMIYRIQFPVLQQYEADTWYDKHGRIVWTNNRSLTNVGYSSQEKKIWEEIKERKTGCFSRKVEEDTLEGVKQREILYEAPFDCCDREKDYLIVWEQFAKRF